MLPVAQIGEFLLPCSFKYEPYVPRIRRTTTATAKAVIHQSANPSIVHGDGIISWSLSPAYPHEWKSLYDIHLADALVTFKGYWGDEYEVYFQMDQNPVRGRLFSGTGSMTVVCVTSLPNPTCNS